MKLPQGWLADAEAEELRRLARGLTVLELGAWKGRSTVVMAKVAKYVISVDRHQGIEGHGESLHEYLANVQHLENVVVVVGDFQLCVPMFHKEIAEMVYIDGDHDEDSVERDTSLVLNHLDTQVIAFHDWDFPSVREGVGRVLNKEPDGLVGSVAFFQVNP